jgi:hypothetical protein
MLTPLIQKPAKVTTDLSGRPHSRPMVSCMLPVAKTVRSSCGSSPRDRTVSGGRIAKAQARSLLGGYPTRARIGFRLVTALAVAHRMAGAPL